MCRTIQEGLEYIFVSACYLIDHRKQALYGFSVLVKKLSRCFAITLRLVRCFIRRCFSDTITQG